MAARRHAGATPPRQLTAEGKVRLLLEIGRRSSRTLDLGETLDHLLESVRSVLDYDAAGIFVRNEDLDPRDHRGGVIGGVARRGYPERPVADDAMLSSGEGLVGEVIRTGKGLAIADVRREPRYVAGRDGTLSEIVVPIRLGGRAIGALNLESDEPAAYDDGDLEALGFFAEAAAIAIDKAMLHRQLLDKEQLERQLQIGREVQGRLLPQAPPQVPGWEIAGLCLPSLQLGGDYFDWFARPSGRLGVAIADVAGKGVAAALIMATFRALLRAELERRRDLPAVLDAVGRLLRGSAGPRAFVTCFYGELEPASGRLDFVNAGHPPPLVLRAGGALEELAGCDPALGVFTGAAHGEHGIELAPGDTLLLYTDGLTEVLGPGGEQLGIERVAACLRDRRALPALLDELVRRAREFGASRHLEDDLTLVALRRRGRRGERTDSVQGRSG